MQWLMVHMWTALAAAGALGLLFGWSSRGLGLRAKLRRAEGERNIALGSLQEKDSELEALYAAGRTPSSSEGVAINDEELRQELQEREQKLQTLADELARSKAELNDLRENGGGSELSEGVATGAATVAALTAIGSADEEANTLEWRNRYLESRVRSLETKLSELGGETKSAISKAATGQGGQCDKDSVAAAKLRWQNDYLKQRLNFFETNRSASATATSFAAVSTSPEIVSNEDADTPSDEEIAKLRWRNRYLEGRLAYYEGDKSEEEKNGDSGIAELAASSAAAIVDSEDAADDIDLGSLDIELPPEESNDVPITEIETEIPTLAQEEVGVQPIALEAPIGGEGDDLTAIGGIGPKIQEVLNELGIFHYDQIAAWSKDNIDWIDEHLAFQGRIEREQWVSQAAALSDDE